MPMSIDLSTDCGEDTTPEGLARDIEMLEFVTSVNIACGRELGHAGDDPTARALIAAAAQHGVAVGAHPSYPDAPGFGRRELAMTPAQVEESVRAQVAWLAAIARREGAAVSHIKPHGALYHASMRPGGEPLAMAIARGAAAALTPGRVRMVGLAGSPALAAWSAAGFFTLAEAFIDRCYEPDGSLRPRTAPEAVHDESYEAGAQALALARREGPFASIAADTLCVHSDTPRAPEFARAARLMFADAGIAVLAPPPP